MTELGKKYCNGYILAGGKSSRMGEDKGLMLFKGKPVVQYVIDALSPVVDKVIIVSNNPDFEAFGLKVIMDEMKDIGPAGGIYTALLHSDTENNFIISCDMPFVKESAIQFILDNAGEEQIVLPEHSGQLEPLFGIYKKEVLAEWKRLVQNGEKKLQTLIGQFDLLKINAADHKIFNEYLFENINTREEFEKALKHNEN